MSTTCVECQNKFVIHARDLEFYQTINVPPPTRCPLCRHQLRNAYRNERHLYQRTCDLCHKSILSMYSPDKPYVVYCRACWWSDQWSPLTYGRAIDFTRPFFDQFAELRLQVPRIALLNDADSENSDYCNHCQRLKNCYLVTDAVDNEGSLYCNGLYDSKDCVDCTYVTTQAELCYGCLFVKQSYNLRYSRDCDNCRDSAFLIDCVGVSNSLMCVGLRNVSYCFKNKQLTAAEYSRVIKQYDTTKRSAVQQYQAEFNAFAATIPRKYFHGTRNEASDGDYLTNNNSVHHSFQTQNSEQSSYCFGVQAVKNCYDMMVWGKTAELVYYSQAVGNDARMILFGHKVWGGQEVYYGDDCLNGAQYGFGVIALKQEKYCILNKPYTEAEFFTLRQKLIAHMTETKEWGEYFPKALALFGYNESYAQHFVPLTKAQALAQGWTWQDNLPGTFKKETLVEIPDDISVVKDSITKEILACTACQRNYKILAAELTFYQTNRIPLPDLCPTCRHNNRMKQVPPFQLWERQCMKSGCTNSFQTAYAPNRPEIIYCETCYQAKFY